MDYTEAQREQYNKDVLGEDYASIKFNDMFGDEVVVSEFLAEDPDNMVVRVGDIWFGTQKSGISGLKPKYPCAEAGRLGTVDRSTKYISVASMGCPCQGAANYDAVMNIITSNLQVLYVKPTGTKTSWLVSHEVLNEQADWVSEAHCQEGTQLTYYVTYQLGLENIKINARYNKIFGKDDKLSVAAKAEALAKYDSITNIVVVYGYGWNTDKRRLIEQSLDGLKALDDLLASHPHRFTPILDDLYSQTFGRVDPEASIPVKMNRLMQAPQLVMGDEWFAESSEDIWGYYSDYAEAHGLEDLSTESDAASLFLHDIFLPAFVLATRNYVYGHDDFMDMIDEGADEMDVLEWMAGESGNIVASMPPGLIIGARLSPMKTRVFEPGRKERQERQARERQERQARERQERQARERQARERQERQARERQERQARPARRVVPTFTMVQRAVVDLQVGIDHPIGDIVMTLTDNLSPGVADIFYSGDFPRIGETMTFAELVEQVSRNVGRLLTIKIIFGLTSAETRDEIRAVYDRM